MRAATTTLFLFGFGNHFVSLLPGILIIVLKTDTLMGLGVRNAQDSLGCSRPLQWFPDTFQGPNWWPVKTVKSKGWTPISPPPISRSKDYALRLVDLSFQINICLSSEKIHRNSQNLCPTCLKQISSDFLRSKATNEINLEDTTWVYIVVSDRVRLSQVKSSQSGQDKSSQVRKKSSIDYQMDTYTTKHQ